MLKVRKLARDISCSSFSTKEGADEFFLVINARGDIPFGRSLGSLYKNYVMALKRCGLSSDTQIFSRYYLSDIANQKEELLQSRVYKLSQNGAYSVIQQCPLNGEGVALFAYHIKDKNNPLVKESLKIDDEKWRNGIKVKRRHYSLFWIANLSGYGPLNSFEQTNEIFSTYNDLVNSNGMTLLRNTIRTWIYVRDIDNNYSGMADSRKDYFLEQGLTKDTRYIASTGIEAKLKEPYSLVSLDAFSISNLQDAQVQRMEAPEYLCPTYDYGITFERGTMVVFGDRAHLYISGTASIDKKGKVLHPTDIKKQTRRTLENIAALLRPYNADLNDMAYLIIYLRNITEVNKVKEILKEYISEKIPMIIVEGAVCRSAWLIEIEGLGVIPNSNSFPPF